MQQQQLFNTSFISNLDEKNMIDRSLKSQKSQKQFL